MRGASPSLPTLWAGLRNAGPFFMPLYRICRILFSHKQSREDCSIEQEVAGVERTQLGEKELGTFACDRHNDAEDVIQGPVKQALHIQRKRDEPQCINEVVVQEPPKGNAGKICHERMMQAGAERDERFSEA